MEVCIPYTPASQDKGNDGGSATDPCHCDHHNLRDLSGNDLETCLSEFLNLEDNKLSTSSFYQFADKNVTGNVVREDKQHDLDGLLVGKLKQDDIITAEVSEASGCDKSVNQHYSQSIPLPKSSKIASAMKGSREKRGIEPKKLSVTWAPDVYDPVPTAASHVPSNKNQRYRNDGKRYGKNKLKGGGKSSRGSKGKDKKQVYKNNGGNKVKPIHDDNGFVGFSKPVMGIKILMSGVHTPSVEVVF